MDTSSIEFQSVIVALVVLWVSTRIIKANSAHIFTLLAAGLLIWYLNKNNTESNLDFIKNTEYKLNILGTPSYFHYDVNIIDLFYSIYNWRELNENNFDSAIEAVNNLLAIESETENVLQRCVDNYETARDFSNTAINLIHGFIYNIDHPLLVKKLKVVLQRLQQLLTRHLRTIESNCKLTEKKKKSIDINTKFIYSGSPQGFDPLGNVNFSLFDMS